MTTRLATAAPNGPARLPARADRRESLLDAAAGMVAADSVESVSMEAVASAAGVSRALVYKHFTNRHDLLSALYERESALLHAELAAGVQATHDLAGMLRALVRGAIQAQATRGATLAALSSGAARSPAQRGIQRRRDGRTLRYFARQAVAEFGVDELDARTGLAVVLGSLPTVLARWRARPTARTADHLEAIFVIMAVGGIKALARRPRLREDDGS